MITKYIREDLSDPCYPCSDTENDIEHRFNGRHGFEGARGWLIVRLTSRRIPKSSYSNEYGTKIQPPSTLTSYGVECLLRPQGVQVAESAEL